MHDYEAPLDRLPPVRRVPEHLPFGPPEMSLFRPPLGRVIVGEGSFGYGVSEEADSIRRQVRLDWDVRTTLSRIDRRGRVVRQVDAEDQHFGVVREVEDMSFWFNTPPGPALYRYDIEFRDHLSGALLGSYSEYLRVVKPTFHAGIAVNRRHARPGQKVFARVENRGTSWIEFGLYYEVQRFEGGRWVDQDLGDGVWALPLIYMRSGQSGWCMRYRVPTEASPGRYRFVKDLGFIGRRGKRAVAAFRVGR